MVITRFAPSPTGDLHIGGVRTALYSWLHARQHQGKFKLRIEDTDLERSTAESTQVILEGMKWLGLDHDGEIVYQSLRFDLYNKIIEQLLKEGKAYYCWCTPEELEKMREEQIANGLKPRYNGKYRNGGKPVPGVTPVVRFKTPLEGDVIWNDHVRGRISISNTELDDFVIRRSDGAPIYNFCVVIDDHDQEVSLIIRGDDHISNTPKQINIYKALGYEVPEFAHVPMILGDDGKRLSKRHGATNVLDYKKEGYLPEAVINYLIRLGWAYGDQEIFTIEELLKEFKIDDVHSAPSSFNTEKLRWLNQQYLIKADVEYLAALLPEYQQAFGYRLDHETMISAIPSYTERAKTLREMAENMKWLAVDPETSAYPEKQVNKAFKGKATIDILTSLAQRFAVAEKWDEESIHKAFEETVVQYEVSFGKVALPARLALTGGAPSPDLALCFKLAGRDSALRRIENAQKFIAENQ